MPNKMPNLQEINKSHNDNCRQQVCFNTSNAKKGNNVINFFCHSISFFPKIGSYINKIFISCSFLDYNAMHKN